MTQARIVINADDRTGGAFRAVGEKARNLQGQIDGVGRGFAGLGGTIAAALSGFGIATFVQQTTEGLLAIKDLSEATGASIANISGLEDVARRAGSSMEDARSVLLKFNTALKDTERTKELGAALKAVGLDADKLRQLDPAQALLEAAKALDQFADDGNKARLQAELFGRSVATAAPLLKELAEAGQLNATVTQAQVEQADRFNKELARLSKSGTDAARVVGGELASAVNGLFDVLRGGHALGSLDQFLAVPLQSASVLAANVAFVIRGIGTEIGGLAAQAAAVARLDFAGASAIGEAMADDAARARKEFDALERRLLSIGSIPVADYSNEGRNFLPRLRSVPDLAGAGVKLPKAPTVKTGTLADPQIGEAMRDALRAIEQTDTAKISAVNAALDELFALRAGGIGAGGGVDEAIERLRDELQKLDPAAKAAAATTERLQALLASTRQSRTEGVLGDIVFLNEQFSAGKIASAEQWADAVRAVTARLHETDAVADKTGDAMRELGLTFSSAFEDAIVGGARLSEVLQGLAQDVLRIFVRQTITQPAGSWLANLFTGTLFGGARATGGPVSAGRPYLVGELGPEIVVPSTSGIVVPNGAGAGAAVNVSIVQHIGQGVSRAEVYTAAMQAKESAKAELLQTLRRARSIA